MVEPPGLNFVALGDSLTVGFMPPNPLQRYLFPYTDFLDEILAEKLSEKGLDYLDVSLVNLVVNGDTTWGMLCRFDEQVAPNSPDYVIVWGGVNDIFGMRPSENIMMNLEQIYVRTREIGAKPIPCTVTSVLGFDFIIPCIRRLNCLIKERCENNEIPVVDLFPSTSDESGRLMEAHSSDGVHLTEEGYKKIASTIYSDSIEPILDKFLK